MYIVDVNSRAVCEIRNTVVGRFLVNNVEMLESDVGRFLDMLNLNVGCWKKLDMLKIEGRMLEIFCIC